MTEEKNTQLIKVIVILVTIIFCALITIALIQTFTIKKLEKNLDNIQIQNEVVLDKIEETQNEIDIRENPETKDEYANEVLEKDGYGQDGEVIYKNS